MKSSKIILYVVIGVLILVLSLMYMYFKSVTDIENVKLEGYIYDKKTSIPIENVTIIINSDRYQNDLGHENFDEYLGHDIIELKSNKDGFYSTTIKRSAFLWIDFKKDGYISTSKEGDFSSKYIKDKIYLEKVE